MQHPITKQTVVVTLDRDYDYLTAGVPYLATPYKNGKGARFDRLDESSGTFLPAWGWKQVLNGGFATIVPAAK